jgi:hypothetical protein
MLLAEVSTKTPEVAAALAKLEKVAELDVKLAKAKPGNATRVVPQLAKAAEAGQRALPSLSGRHHRTRACVRRFSERLQSSGILINMVKPQQQNMPWPKRLSSNSTI